MLGAGDGALGPGGVRNLTRSDECMVTIAVTAEPADEPRVAVSPETVKKLVALGAKVKVEAGAGARSRFSDDALRAQGAEIAPTAAEALRDADILLRVRRPAAADLAGLKPGALVIAMLDPYGDRAALQALAGSNASLFTMEFMPRITRAQSMDVLSSQANLAGYKAVVDAAAMFQQAMPMMMTAAGTVPAARVFVMGAGVAGLQAIATARRLGAQVSATDVRPASKEQVASLGGKFIAVEDEEFKQAQTAAGYAKPMSPEYQAKQAELVAAHIKNQDIVITTALIPGRPAPRLITRAMVESMKPGSVIVDLAAERGGNCELTQPGQIVDHNGVRIFGPLNLAGAISVNASSLYAKNLYAFLETLIDKKEKTLAVNWDDEIVKGTLIARDGKIVHPSLQGAA
jgi:H+-translocating NAD(P) transhydrogenase subunit alpha